MKKKLLLFASFALFALSSNAQDKVWDFSDEAIWTKADLAEGTVDGLFVKTGGKVEAVTTAYAVAFPDGFAPVNALKIGSAGSLTVRYLSFPVSGPCTVKVWFGQNNSGRTVSVSDGTAVLNSFKTASPSPYRGVLTAEYTSSNAGNIYIYASNGMDYYKVSVSSTSLGTNDIKADSSATVYANGNQVFVANVKSNTTVAVYSVSGALVKTVETSSDTSFDLASGVYVAKVKSAEGEKSVKLLVK